VPGRPRGQIGSETARSSRQGVLGSGSANHPLDTEITEKMNAYLEASGAGRSALSWGMADGRGTPGAVSVTVLRVVLAVLIGNLLPLHYLVGACYTKSWLVHDRIVSRQVVFDVPG